MEIHEAFAGQVLYQIKALESASFLRDKAKVECDLGKVPRDRINPNGGSVALGHPFGATGARILSQPVKELSAMQKGPERIVSICAAWRSGECRAARGVSSRHIASIQGRGRSTACAYGRPSRVDVPRSGDLGLNSPRCGTDDVVRACRAGRHTAERRDSVSKPCRKTGRPADGEAPADALRRRVGR